MTKPNNYDLIRQVIKMPDLLRSKNPFRAAELYAIEEQRLLTNAEVDELDDLIPGRARITDEEVEAAAAKAWAKICEMERNEPAEGSANSCHRGKHSWRSYRPVRLPDTGPEEDTLAVAASMTEVPGRSGPVAEQREETIEDVRVDQNWLAAQRLGVVAAKLIGEEDHEVRRDRARRLVGRLANIEDNEAGVGLSNVLLDFPPATLHLLNRACELAGDLVDTRFHGAIGTAVQLLLKGYPQIRQSPLDFGRVLPAHQPRKKDIVRLCHRRQVSSDAFAGGSRKEGDRKKMERRCQVLC